MQQQVILAPSLIVRAGSVVRHEGFVRPHGEGCAVSIVASAGARRTEIGGLDRWRGAVHVRIAAEPLAGEANKELLAFLARLFSVPKDSVRLLRGERSARKVVFVPLPAERAKAALEGA